MHGCSPRRSPSWRSAVDIHWLEQNASDVPCEDLWLSGKERACLADFRIPKRRADWRMGRWTAKCAISRYFNLAVDPDSLAAVELLPDPSGAPRAFVYGEPAPAILSLSHSGGIGLCAIGPTGGGLGCDLERVERRSAAFLTDYFTRDEQQLVAQTPAVKRDEMLTLLWSAKESVLKALCCGLRLDTRSVNAIPADILRPNGEVWRPLYASHDCKREFHGWWRESQEFVYTIVADPPPVRLIGLHLRETAFECRTCLQTF
jgi:4'-phosphopantetheinyl transferase